MTGPGSGGPAGWLERPSTRWIAIALGAFAAIGAWLVRGAHGEPALRWMLVHDFPDIPSVRDALLFFRDTLVPIPPVVGLMEVVDWQVRGNLDLSTIAAYRIGLVVSYLLALWLAATSKARLLASFVTSLVFLHSTLLIHPRNPQTYDVLFPLFTLAFVATLPRQAPAGASPAALARSFACGFFLAMAELLRPFFVLVLPFALAGAYQAFRDGPRRCFASFLVPVVVLSGGWHLNQIHRHGRLVWSNHGGFNLVRAWPMVDPPEMLLESSPIPPRPGRWPNLDTAIHAENSRRFTAAVVSWMARHPVTALRHACYRLERLVFDVDTAIYDHRPESWVFGLYRQLARGAAAVCFGCAVLAGLDLLRRGRRGRTLGQPDHVLAVVAILSIVLLSVGDAGEEARFLISVLPMLAALPIHRAAGAPPVTPGSNSELGR